MEDKVEPLRLIVERALRRQNLWRKVHSYEVFEVWYDCFGPDVTERLRPEKVHGGTLFLVSSDHAWAQEFFFMQTEILKVLWSALGDNAIQRIRVRSGPLPEIPLRPPLAGGKGPGRPVPRGLADLVDPGPIRDALQKLEHSRTKNEGGR